MAELVKKLGAVRGTAWEAALPVYVVHPRLCAETARGRLCAYARCSYAHSIAELVEMWAQVAERVVDEVRCEACIEAPLCCTKNEPLDARCVPLPAGSGASCSACRRTDSIVAVEGGSSGGATSGAVRLYKCASLSGHTRGGVSTAASHFVPIPPTPRDAESMALCGSARACADVACIFAHSPVVLAVWLRDASQAAAAAAAAAAVAATAFDGSDETALVAPTPTPTPTPQPNLPTSPSPPHSPRRRTVSPISVLQPLSPGPAERCVAHGIVPRRLFAVEDKERCGGGAHADGSWGAEAARGGTSTGTIIGRAALQGKGGGGGEAHTEAEAQAQAPAPWPGLATPIMRDPALPRVERGKLPACYRAATARPGCCFHGESHDLAAGSDGDAAAAVAAHEHAAFDAMAGGAISEEQMYALMQMQMHMQMQMQYQMEMGMGCREMGMISSHHGGAQQQRAQSVQHRSVKKPSQRTPVKLSVRDFSAGATNVDDWARSSTTNHGTTW
jgi:hypothetical protein